MNLVPTLATALLFGSGALVAQTLYVPSGTSGIGTSPNGNVGIGTSAPAYKLEVVGDVRSTGAFVEKKVIFTPTAVGWYRIVSGAGQAGGTIRTDGAYDGGSTALEFVFNIRGWGQHGTLTLVKNSAVNGGLIDSARISTDGGSNVYLDVHVSTATAPGPITILGYGPGMPAFVASPVVGATPGSTDVRVLPLGWSVGAYDDFRTSGNVVTYSNDGSTPQGFIYHGTSGQAAFGNGVTNGETWITRTGGSGSIKLGDYDLNVAYLTVAGSSGNVGIGTTNPSARFDVEAASYEPLFLVHSNTAGNNVGKFINDFVGGVVFGDGASGNALQVLSPSGAGTVTVKSSGNVGIGTTNPTYPLTVNGAVRAKEVIVDTGWSDYVFDEHYKLAPLSEVESHIKAEKHLPGLPSAQQVAEHGISVGEMQAKLLAKIEELTLHQIEQEKRISHLEQENQELRTKVNP